MEKVRIPAEQLHDVISSYRKRYSYDEMSEDEKADFDDKLAQVIEIDDMDSDEDDADQNDDSEHAIGQKVLRMRR